MAAALSDRHELLPLLTRPPNDVIFQSLSTSQLVSLYEALALSPSNLETVLAAAEHEGIVVMNHILLHGRATSEQAANHAQHDAICSNPAFAGAVLSVLSQIVSHVSAQPPAVQRHAWDNVTNLLNYLLAGMYAQIRGSDASALTANLFSPLFSISNITALAAALNELERQVCSVDSADMDDDDTRTMTINLVGCLAQMHTLLRTAAVGGDPDGLLCAFQLRINCRAVDYAEQHLGVQVPAMDANELKRWYTTTSRRVAPARCGCPSCTATANTHELLRCSQCKLVFYCSREHQRADWPRHRILCQAAQLAREAPRPAPSSRNPAAFHAAGSGAVRVARALRVVMTGFEGVGKSTILSDLELGTVQRTALRTGEALEVCGDDSSDLSWICFDLADGERGMASERELRTMLCRPNGLLPTVRSLVFVLDASRPQDFGRARERLVRLLAQEWAAPDLASRRPPLVVLAHKADRSGARTAVEVSEALGVDQLRLDRPVLCTSSMHAAAGGQSGLENVVTWIEEQTRSWDSRAI